MISNNRFLLILAIFLIVNTNSGFSQEVSSSQIEKQFHELPMEARQYIGPLFWLHGTESKERLEYFVVKMAEMGNGSFTAESRPHNDWLGEGWYRDLKVSLDAAKKNNLKMWIFDERWYPSQGVDWKVPPRYAAKKLEATAIDISGQKMIEYDGYSGDRYVATVAGRILDSGKIDENSLVDLAPYIKNGKLDWQVPEGQWKIMKFTHVQAIGSRVRQGKELLVDGASKDCVDWFLQTVYQPHYDRFKDDFGKTIKGYFFDEPETPGDWGTELNKILAEWNVDWKKAYVAYKFELAGDDQVAAKYQYIDAFAEAWGRTMYGGMTQWCKEHGVKSIGHFWEHNNMYHLREWCAGDMVRLMKYCDMGGIDAVVKQFVPGKHITTDSTVYQSPKLGSSVTHVFNKLDHLTLVEIFGNRGQDLTYPEMKWWTDHMLASGVNFFIPHSFNPRAPKDVDNPPFFFMDDFEPRWPLYKVYADYASRSSLLLTGGKHIAPVAFLYFGNTINVGKAITFEHLSAALQDALFDCDLMPFDVFEKNTLLEGKEIKLYDESYKILVVPPVELIPFATLLKVKDFYDKGGVVLGYGFLPSKSATVGKTSSDIKAICSQIWGEAKPGISVCKTNFNGGRSYLLPTKPTSEQLQQVLTDDAGIHPTLEVVDGKTDNWLHVLHRVKEGHDVFFIANQNIDEKPRQFTFRVTAKGFPECWDAMRNRISSIPYKRSGDKVDITLTLEPNESVFIIFQDEKRELSTLDNSAVIQKLEVQRDLSYSQPEVTRRIPGMIDIPTISGTNWIWYPEENSEFKGAQGTRYFRKTFIVSDVALITNATLVGMGNSEIDIIINGTKVESSNFNREIGVIECDVAKLLKPGNNLIAVSATNKKAPQSGMICKLTIKLNNQLESVLNTDNTWKVTNEPTSGWYEKTFDDSKWLLSTIQGKCDFKPFFPYLYTFSPVKTDYYKGVCIIPVDWIAGKFSAFLEAGEILPESAAKVIVNGNYVGGFLGKPFRIDVSKYMKKGANEILIEPFAPKSVNIVLYENQKQKKL